MDPATIIGTAFAISKVVYSCSTTLYTFAKDVEHQDGHITGLYGEVEGLRKCLESIAKTLQSPSVKRYDQLPLWEDVGDGLGECQKTVLAFHKKLETIRPASPERVGKFKACVAQLKLNFSDEDIKSLRAQVHSHSLAMQMILQMINVHISSTSPEVVLDELTPQLHHLVKLVTELHESALPPGIANVGLKRSRTRLERSAQEVASKASAVVSSRSTIWSGSQVEFPSSKSNATIVAVAAKHSTTTGSEYGEPLSSEDRTRISLWMDQDFRDGSTMPAISEESPSIFSERASRSNDSNTTPLTKHTSIVASYEDDEDLSDEDEIEIDVARRYMVEGRKKLGDDPAQAEAFLRKALTKLGSMRSTVSTTELIQIKLDVAFACFEQGKLDQSTEFCQRLLEAAPADDRAREIILQASHLLSQIHFEKGRYDGALRQCKRTLNGRKRFNGKDDAYFESVALMATIYRSKGDEIEATTYADLLPKGFAPAHPKEPSVTVVESTVFESDCAQEQNYFDQLDAERKDNDDTLSRKESDEPPRASTSMTVAEEPFMSPTLSLPSTVKARMERAKALSDSINVMRKSSTPEYFSLDSLQQVREDVRNRRNRMRSSCSDLALDSIGKETAIRLLEESGLGSNKKPDLDAHFLRAAKEGLTLPVRLLLTDWEYHKRSTFFRSAGRVQYRRVRLEVVDDHFRNALHLAAMNGRSEVVRILLDHGVSRFSRMNGMNGHTNVVNSMPGLGPTPVELAIQRGHLDTVKEFIQAGCCGDPSDLNGWTLLHHSAFSGNTEVFSLLVDTVLDVEAQSSGGRTPLHIAALRGHDDIVAIILSMSVKVDRTDHKGCTPLSLAFSKGHVRCIQRLLEHGANRKTLDNKHESLLHIAAEQGLVKEIHDLVDNGITVNLRDKNGQTPLNEVASANQLETVNALLLLGASINCPGRYGDSPLHCAARQNHLEIVERLIFAGAMVDQTNENGETALMVAASNGYEPIVQRLVAEKVAINLADRNGMTAYDLAKASGHTSIARLLRRERSRMTFDL